MKVEVCKKLIFCIYKSVLWDFIDPSLYIMEAHAGEKNLSIKYFCNHRHFYLSKYLFMTGATDSVMVSRVHYQTCKSEFESHWVTNSIGLVQKNLNKLLLVSAIAFLTIVIVKYLETHLKPPNRLKLLNTLTASLQMMYTAKECTGYDTYLDLMVRL